jgi:hypothetical protein
MKPALLALAALTTGGCVIDVERTGPLDHDHQAVDLDKAEMVRAELKMGAGELMVEGGSRKLIEGDFSYNVAAWKPAIKYTSSGVRGNLTVEQPHSVHAGGKMKYRWDLRLNDKVPMDVVVEFGAGEAKLNLGDLNLRSVQVHMGVGELRMDLRGKPSRDYSVTIDGGVGQATVYLPRDVGIIANATGGIGNISVSGLKRRGGRWINPAHENAPIMIHVDVHGGIGEIRLIAD